MPEQRLANQIAKRRARRYLAQIDDLISPTEEPTAADGATPPAEGDAPATPPAEGAPAATP